MAFQERKLSRRAAVGTLAGLALPSLVSAAEPSAPKAIAFDAFVLFDQRSIIARGRTFFQDKGETLVKMWLGKLFDYTWITTSAGHYSNFATLADTSLTVTAETLKLEMSPADRSALLATFAQLDAWPDVAPAVSRLRQHGIRLVLLSNLGETALNANMARAGLTSSFEPPLSTDRVHAFKPSPAAYQMAIDALRLPKEAIRFAAFGGWDAAGATWFGYRTAWVNRFEVPMDRLGTSPAIVGRGMDGVLKLAGL